MKRVRNQTLDFFLLGLLAVLLLGQTIAEQGDVGLYEKASGEILAGRVPYRDFPIEYPPFALLAFLLPRLPPLNFLPYNNAFALVSVGWTALVAFVVWRMAAKWRGGDAPDTLAVARCFAGLAFWMGLLIPGRYDIFPTALTALALLAALSDRPGWAGVWTGLGIAAKIYPIIFVPIFAVYWLAQRRPRAVAALLTGTLGAALAVLLPFALMASHALLYFISYHQHRPLQVETGAAGLAMLAHLAGLSPASTGMEYVSFNIHSSLAKTLLPLLPFVFALLWAGVSVLAWRGFRDEHAATGAVSPRSLLAFSTATLLLFLVVNKVFSPQFVIWLLPFLPLLDARTRRVGLWIFALTTFIFPFAYNGLLSFNPFMVLILNVRNGLIVWLAVRLLRDSAPDSVSVPSGARRLLGGLVALTVAGGLIAYRIVTRATDEPRPPGTAPRDTRLMPATASGQPVGSSLWLSDDKTIVIGRGNFELVYVTQEGRGAIPGLTAFRRRVDLTGKSSPLRLTNWDAIQLSPDKKRLLWQGQNVWAAASLDGANLRVWPAAPERQTRAQRRAMQTGMWWPDDRQARAAWLPDSRHWMEVTTGETPRRLRLHSVDSGAVKDYALPLGKPLVAFQMTGANTALFVVRGGPTWVQTATFTLGQPRTVTLPITLPPGISADSCAISPQGDRLVWLLSSSGQERAIAVSRLDGSGFSPIIADLPVPLSEIPPRPHWLPSGTRIGFWQGGRLWSAPAPP